LTLESISVSSSAMSLTSAMIGHQSTVSSSQPIASQWKLGALAFEERSVLDPDKLD
jgi:hypothetical protein